MTKRVLYDSPEKAKLLAYTTLCRPHVEYVSTVWNPSMEQLQHKLDIVQNVVIRFICKFKGRDSVTEALEKVDVPTLGDRRKTSKHNLLLRLPLIDSYDELMITKTSILVMRAAERGVPSTIYA